MATGAKSDQHRLLPAFRVHADGQMGCQRRREAKEQDEPAQAVLHVTAHYADLHVDCRVRGEPGQKETDQQQRATEEDELAMRTSGPGPRGTRLRAVAEGVQQLGGFSGGDFAVVEHLQDPIPFRRQIFRVWIPAAAPGWARPG